MNTAELTISMRVSEPTVIGLYGVSGCGKTYLWNRLKGLLGEDEFIFFEGSAVIDGLVRGGLEKFLTLNHDVKQFWRRRAIEKISEDSAASQKTAIVTGHYMFWKEGEKSSPVYTESDSETYTHIIYLDVEPELVAQRCREDRTRNRTVPSVEQIKEWQEHEKFQLRQVCRENNILFLSLSTKSVNAQCVGGFINDFCVHNKQFNSRAAKEALQNVMTTKGQGWKTVLVFDADRTLTAQDTGKMFWDSDQSGVSPLDSIFRSPLQYRYEAFHQATLLYEENFTDDEFERRCRDVAANTNLYAEFISLLRIIRSKIHVGVVIVTCGLRRIWEEIMHREGMSDKVKVIGGGRISDRFVVDSDVKKELVEYLRIDCNYVWAFGDSPLDIPMLQAADQAVVVVGNESQRSKTMDEKLKETIKQGHLKARQVLLPSTVSPRFNTKKLPVTSLTQREFIADVLARGQPTEAISIQEATWRPAAKLLMTAMHDARNNGPALCKAHRRAGEYLATEFVSGVIGLEKISIPHVQGHVTDGHRLLHEDRTVIVSLMRGGEPMAQGVWDVFPTAMFIHAKSPTDIKPEHLEGHINLILVDSVINSGKSMAEFVHHVRNLHATICIVVVAGVVQKGCITGSLLSQANVGTYDRLNIVALRLSDNKYTGSGGTDTGNRLFNTTHLA